MKRPYFQKKSGVNADLITLDNFNNGGYLIAETETWFCDAEISGNDYNLIFKSVSGLTGLTVVEHTETVKTIVAETDNVILGYTLHVDDDNIFGLISIQFDQGGANPFRNEVYSVYSEDGGSSWTAFFVWQNLSAGDWIPVYIMRTLKIGGVYFVYFSAESVVQTSIFFTNVKDGINADSITDPNHYDEFYQGTYYEGNYVFVYHDGSDLIKASFDGATITIIETLSGVSIPTTWDPDHQIFIEKGNGEILVDPYYLQSRSLSSNWSAYSSITAVSVSVIFNIDYVIAYVGWDTVIREVTDKGILKNIQALEPRDYKKTYLTNSPATDDLAGVVQFTNRNGNDSLSLWTDADSILDVLDLVNGSKKVLEFQTDAIDELAEISVTNSSSGVFDLYITLYQTNKQIRFDLRSAAGSMIAIDFDITGNIDILGSATDANVDTYVANIKYHFNITYLNNGASSIKKDDVEISTQNCKAQDFEVFRIKDLTGSGGGIVDSMGHSVDSFVTGSNKKINAFVGFVPAPLAWDHKLTYLTNEEITGIVQIGTAAVPLIGDWTDPDSTLTVISLLGSHLNTLDFEVDAVEAAILDITLSTSGTHEFWIYLYQTNKTIQYKLVNGVNSQFCEIHFDSAGNIDLKGATDSDNIDTYAALTWYRIKIVYLKNGNCTFSKATGLGAYAALDTITGQNIDFERIRIVNTSGLGKCSLDGISLSADKYTVGDNAIIPDLAFDKPWFATGDSDTGIMELSLKDYSIGTRKSLTETEMYKAPRYSLIRTVEPFEDEWIKQYTNAAQLFYGGKVKSNKSDNRFFYLYKMNGWIDEYKDTKITLDLSAVTYKEFLEHVIDNFSNYMKYGRGTNADIDEFDAVLTGWTNTDGTGCVSSYLSKKIFVNGILKRVLQQYDNNNPAYCQITKTVDDFNIFSCNVAISDVTQRMDIRIYEDATEILEFIIDASLLRIYNGGFVTVLDPAVNNTIYHIALDFNITDDDVDVYLDGVPILTSQNLSNNITTACNTILIRTWTDDNAYYDYVANIYHGDSLVNAMHTYSSISPLLTTTKDFKLKNESHRYVQELIAEETGYIVSVRPDGMTYLDQFAPSGKHINVNESQGMTFQSKIWDRNEKFSLITFYGGFAAGKQISSTGFGEPNFGTHEDWFPSIRGEEAGDLYYDADGNPKSIRLDAMITTALVNRNIRKKDQLIGKRGTGMFLVGTSHLYTNAHWKIAAAVWYAWRKVKYNGITDDSRLEHSDSLTSPTKSDDQDGVQAQTEAAIANNAEEIKKVEQTVSQTEESINDPAGPGINPSTLLLGIAVYEDLTATLSAAKIGALNAPTWTKWMDDGAASVGVYANAFADQAVAGNEEQMWIHKQIQHAYKEGEDIEIHIHWGILTAGAAGEFVKWGIEIQWANKGGVFSNTAIYTSNATSAATATKQGDATLIIKKHYVTIIKVLGGTGKTISSMINCRLFRNSSHADDDLAEIAFGFEVDFHVPVDTLGSTTKEAK